MMSGWVGVGCMYRCMSVCVVWMVAELLVSVVCVMMCRWLDQGVRLVFGGVMVLYGGWMECWVDVWEMDMCG